MTVEIPALALLLAVVVLLVRKSGLKYGHALLCVLLGFYLADSSAAPTIREVANQVAEMLTRLRF
jgi:hypothetical protein